MLTDDHRVEVTVRSGDRRRIQIRSAAGDFLAAHDCIRDVDVPLVLDCMLTEIATSPRYVVRGGVGSMYAASVFDTEHVRGKSPTRKTIPCATLRDAITVAAELNAGIVNINQ